MNLVERELVHHVGHLDSVRRSISPPSDVGSRERIECLVCLTDITVGVDFVLGAGTPWVRRTCDLT